MSDTQPNEQLIDIAEIERYVRECKEMFEESVTTDWLRALLEERIELVMSRDGYKLLCEEAESQLQQIREELERKQGALEAMFDNREKWRNDHELLLIELEQVKAERDSLQLNLDTMVHHFNETTEELEKTYSDLVDLESELSAKNKVLEFYADEATYDIDHLSKHGYIVIDKDAGEQARTILSQYEEASKPKCPKCGTDKVAQHPSLEQYLCPSCKYVFNGREVDCMPKISKLCDQDTADRYMAELSDEVKK